MMKTNKNIIGEGEIQKKISRGEVEQESERENEEGKEIIRNKDKDETYGN